MRLRCVEPGGPGGSNGPPKTTPAIEATTAIASAPATTQPALLINRVILHLQRFVTAFTLGRPPTRVCLAWIASYSAYLAARLGGRGRETHAPARPAQLFGEEASLHSPNYAR